MKFRPELVYIWNLRGVSISIAFAAHRAGLPLCFFVFDDWLLHWKSDPWASLWLRRPRRISRRISKALLRCFLALSGCHSPSDILKLDHVHFASRYLERIFFDSGAPVTDALTTGWGINVDRYPLFYRNTTTPPTRLLYVGQLLPHKGIHTAIQAIRELISLPGCNSVTLTIVGRSIYPEYEAECRRLVSSLGLTDHVRFTGFIAHDELLPFYRTHDILIFPSLWDEPFGITILEAMACGLAVVCTGTGGSAEIVKDGVNALVFPPGDITACSALAARLISNRELFERIKRNGRETVERRFRFDTLISRIDDSLHTICHENSAVS